MDALDLLTYDCWMEVLLRVKVPEDLKSCSEACLTFQAILRKKKNQFMFSLILPHILEFIDDYGYEEVQWNDLLKCRLVCKSWRKSFDELAADLFQDAYVFDSGERTEQFLQKFTTHSGSPFVGRKVILYLHSPLLLAENQAEGLNPEASFHVRKLRQLLERFGREMWEVELYAQVRNEHIAFCKNLQTVLNHLSDLRTLLVHCSSNLGMEHEFNQEELAEITRYITANPLPALPQLESLQTYYVNVMMTHPLLEKYALQLKSLVAGNPRGFPEQGLRTSNLQKLYFYRLDASTSLNFLGSLRSPLRSLSLDVFQNSSNVELWSIDQLFRNIRQLPIQKLRMTVENVFLGESGPIPAEERPFHESISSITLVCQGGSASFNFLLYCPKLEYIEVYREPPRQGIPAGHPNGVTESVDVNSLLERIDYDLYNSTIWENLPSLIHFGLENYVGDERWRGDDYERDEYERRKLEN